LRLRIWCSSTKFDRVIGSDDGFAEFTAINQGRSFLGRPLPVKILVFRIGQLGDTVVALPAMWAVRRHFPQASLSLLCDQHPGRKYVLGADLLAGAGIFEEFLSYPVDNTAGGTLMRPLRMTGLLAALRCKAFDSLIYLAPSGRTPAQVARDRRFFTAAAIKRFFGMHGFPRLPSKRSSEPLPGLPLESDLLLTRLAADGIPAPPAGEGCFDLNLGKAEGEEVASWLCELPSDGGRRWIGVGPGSKMPAKRWDTERFAQAASALVGRHGVWPVVFGGPEDRDTGEELLQTWGCGYNAAGRLGLRPAAAALKRCALYLGNDTGTMHLAAAVGVTCVAVFSSRDHPGRWYPAGRGHRVLRSQIECEGCRLTECVERRNECLNRISVDDVLAACEAVLKSEPGIKYCATR
jgi:heptosyltransferase III